MNKRVLQAVIILFWIFFLGFAVAKLFFAEWFVGVIHNERIIQIGQFIDDHKLATIMCDLAVSFLSAHFYFCACKQVWKLSRIGYVVIFMYVVGSYIITTFSIIPYTIVDILLMLLLPLLFRSRLKQVVCVFVLNYAGQFLLLFIRSQSIYLADTNYATRFLMFFDAEIWFILYYLYSNLYKEGTLWEFLFSHFSVIKRKKSSKKSLPK